MDIISNSPYDVHSKYGHLILVCLGSDQSKCGQLRLELSKAGYAYLFFPISEDTLSHRDYLLEVTKALDSCSCLIPVISNGLFSEGSVEYRNVFWFVIGYMQAKCEGATVPFLAEGNGLDLALTPLKNANLASSGEDIIKTLETKYSERLMKSQYYDNYLLNYYAHKRILYRRISLKCKIYESDFKKVCELMEYEWGNAAESRLDRFLSTNLNCAYKILSFGCDNFLEPQFEPYREEIHPSENGLSSVSCKSFYSLLDDSEKDADPVRAEVEAEIIVPVHKLFGVYFKCYLALKQKEYSWMLPILFSRDLGKYTLEDIPEYDDMESSAYWNALFQKNVHTDLKKGRFYFSLGLDGRSSERSLKVTPEMGVGSVADYIFPQ